MLKSYIEIKNITGKDQPLRDLFLPGGKLIIPANQSISIPRDVWARNRKRCSGWMREASTVVANAEAETAVEEVETEQIPQEAVQEDQATTETQEPAQVEEETTAAVEEITEQVDTEVILPEDFKKLREMAKELGINTFQMNRDALIEAIKAKTSTKEDA
jgi:hypothetical protein